MAGTEYYGLHQPQPQPAAPPSDRRRNIAVVAAAVVLVGIVAVVAVATGQHAPTETAITVNFQLVDVPSYFNNCVGTGGYSDIGPGAQATVTDQTGAVLGVADLGQPRVVNGNCMYTTRVAGVPLDKKFYSVQVSHRGTITQSVTELKADRWTFNLTIGSLGE